MDTERKVMQLMKVLRVVMLVKELDVRLLGTQKKISNVKYIQGYKPV